MGHSLEILTQTKEECASSSLTLDSLLKNFVELKQQSKENYRLCNFTIISCSYAYLFLVRIFQVWDPLHDPMHGFQNMSLLKDLLDVGEWYVYSDTTTDASPYIQLVNDLVLPAMRILGANTWKITDPELMFLF